VLACRSTDGRPGCLALTVLSSRAPTLPYNPASLAFKSARRAMSLLPGTRLGPYEIHSALVAGGMGEKLCR